MKLSLTRGLRPVVVASLGLCLMLGQAWALPPQVEADMLMKEIGASTQAGNYGGLGEKFQKVYDLRVKLPESFEFHWGKAAMTDQDFEGALLHLDRYLTKAGSAGKYYDDALDLYTKAKTKVGAQRARKEVAGVLNQIQQLIQAGKVNEAHPGLVQALQAAADKQVDEAQYLLGQAHFEGWLGLPRDGNKAKAAYEAAARQNHAKAEGALGYLHNFAAYVKGGANFAHLASPAEARRWYQRAGAHGNSEALIRWGDMERSDSNLDAAAKAYREALALGDKQAYMSLGFLHYNYTKRYGEAVEWYTKAVQELTDTEQLRAYLYLGHSLDSQDKLGGARYTFESGVQAAQRQGSDNYLKQFYFQLGESYRVGYVSRSGGEDRAKARQWYEKGAALGDKDCLAALKEHF